jgi:RimJ/RimL family protein N-acetyltransferase
MMATEKLFTTLEGKRIYLRELKQEDVTASYLGWMNDPRITRFTDSRGQHYSLESLKRYVADKQKSKNEEFLSIIIKQEKRHIGNIKLGPVNLADNHADIGILIGDREYWGKGYATEAIGLVKKYAFEHLGLHRLTAGSVSSNQGSIKAFLKNGFEIEGIRRQHVRIDGSYVDGILLGLLNDAS